MKKREYKPRFTYDVAKFAAVLVSVASIFATISWVMSGMAASKADEKQWAAIGFMVLRLEATNTASNKLLEAHTYTTQAAVYFTQADAENESSELAEYLDNLGYLEMAMANLSLGEAENAQENAQAYYESYSTALDMSKTVSGTADKRSTSALLFALSALIGSSCVLLKRKEILYLGFPVLLVAMFYLISSSV